MRVLAMARTAGACLAFVCSLVYGAVLSAQSVAIAPHVLVAGARSRTVAITLVNTSDAPAEVSFSTMYGYPVTDSLGRMTLQTFGALRDTMPSAASWVQVLPARLRLAPKAQQVVRLMATPPASLPNGEYWARVVVAARGGRVRVQQQGAAPGVNVGLDLEVRSVLPFFYRNGPVTTGLVLQAPRATVANDSLVVRTHLTRTGTAAFMGTATVRLRSASGATVAQSVLPLSVYYTLDPRIPVALRGVPRGTYQLSVDVQAGRGDMPGNLTVRGKDASASIPVTIP